MSRRLFDGQGGTYLVNNKGIVLIDSFGTIQDTGVNIYEYIKKNYELLYKKDLEKINVMKKNIKNGKVATFDVRSGNDTIFLHYEKLKVNDWYVVTLAPDKIISKKSNLFLGISLILCLIINSIIIIFYFLNQKRSKYLYEAVYIDSVTSLRNELYFRENVDVFFKDTKKTKYIMVVDIKKLRNIISYILINFVIKF